MSKVIGPCKDTQGEDVAEAVGLVKKGITDEQIKHMVTRFLGWRLPENLQPDGGISFKPEYNVEYNAARGLPPSRYQPSGTNFLDASQAEEMVRYMVDGLPGSATAECSDG